jgi:hypothetical protein
MDGWTGSGYLNVLFQHTPGQTEKKTVKINKKG